MTAASCARGSRSSSTTTIRRRGSWPPSTRRSTSCAWCRWRSWPGRRSVPAVAAPHDLRQLPIRRNTLLLSAALAANSGMLQLSAAVASLTLVTTVGVDQLLGLGPAIVLASGALAALPAGRLMDRIGRIPVLAGGFAIGGAGALMAAFGSAADVPPFVLLGLVC